MNKHITRKGVFMRKQGVACYAPTLTAIFFIALAFNQVAFAANLPKNCTDEILALSKGSSFSMSQFASDLPVAVVKAKAQAKLPFGKPKDSEKTSIGMTFGCLKDFPESPGEILSLLKDIGLEGAKGAVAGQTNGLANSASGAASSATPFVAAPNAVVNINLAVIETEMDAELAAAKELTASELSYMTKEIRRLAINNLQNYSIMTEQSVKAQGDVDSQTCRDETCMFSFGKKIGADFIIIGTVSKFRKNYAFTVEVYDAGTGKLVLSSDPVENENVENLLSGFREIAPAFFKSLESRLSEKGNSKEQVQIKQVQREQAQEQAQKEANSLKHIDNVARNSTASEKQIKNFTGEERFRTWALNTLIPIGLGSAVIMNDPAGMLIQIGLNALGVISIAALGTESYSSCSYYYGGNCRSYDTGTRTTEFLPIGIGLLGTSVIYNIVRSATYDKPRSQYSSKEHSGFNLTILPNEHGKFIPHVMYNKAF